MTMTDVHVSIEIKMDFYISEQHLVARQWVKKTHQPITYQTNLLSPRQITESVI